MKALVLFSGGLDSLLAMEIIRRRGIELLALNFVSPFCRCQRKDGCSAVVRLKEKGIAYRLVPLAEEYLGIVSSPRFGRGRNMNPCLDCRVMMFRKAKEIMAETGARFIISGEVLGQRPMSQQRRQLELIEREAGVAGLVLRPLSARLLPRSIAEKEGWVDPDTLYGFSGRMRSPQMNMAQEMGLKDYPCPAGGCLLTDKSFSCRLKDLIRYGCLTMDDVELLKLGRHFRLSGRYKLVVGRNQRENERLLDMVQDGDEYFVSNVLPGPVGLIRGAGGGGGNSRRPGKDEQSLTVSHKKAADAGSDQPAIIGRAAEIVAYYCDGDGRGRIALDRYGPGGESRIEVASMAKSDVERLRI